MQQDLEKVEVVYETMPGWKQSIAHCRTFEELPAEAEPEASTLTPSLARSIQFYWP